MRKFFLLVFVVSILSLNSFSQDRVITYDQLPKISQDFITTHFSKQNISYLKIDEETYGFEYEVYLNDGTKLEFDKSGAMKKVDCGHRSVPEGIVPSKVKTYVSTNYPNVIITEWCKKRTNWKAELSNGLDLYFDNQYQLIGIDD